EFELAATLNVSRSVVRDAVRSLATRGLVEVRQGRGMTVTLPSPHAYSQAALTFLLRSDCTVGDLWDARELLDQAFIGAALASRPADWTAAGMGLRRYQSALDAGRWGEAERGHSQFHLGLLTALPNPVLGLLLEPMQEIILRTSAA